MIIDDDDDDDIDYIDNDNDNDEDDDNTNRSIENVSQTRQMIYSFSSNE